MTQPSATGNRKTAVVTGTSPSSQTLTYNGDNQITTTGYTYDGSGNQTTNPTYTSSYNTAGQRTQTVKGSTHTTYTYAGTNEDELTAETPSSGTPTYHYTYGRASATGLPVIEQVQAGADTAYIMNDNTGTPVLLYSSAGTTCLYISDGHGDPAALLTEYNYTAFAQTFDPYGTGTYTADSGGNGTTQNPYTLSMAMAKSSVMARCRSPFLAR